MLSLDEMSPIDLLKGDNRKECLSKLETYLKERVDFHKLIDNADYWYWQSSRYPEFVLLRKWFE